jgi:hypothetical protein
MFLVAVLDIPTRQEVDDLIREAEQLLIDAALDDEFRPTITRTAPPSTAPREGRSGDLVGREEAGRRMSPSTTRVPWARSPPG